MRKILRQRTQSGTLGASSGTNLQALAASATRRPRTASDEVSRRSSTSRPTTDILSHLQELKAKERQVLGRGPRDTASVGSSNAAGQSKQSLSAEELKSRQERQAHEERMATQYRQQLNTRMQEISDSAIDLSHQKTIMAQLERQLLGSSSPRDLEQLELDRVNGIRSLIGLPPLPPLPALSTGSVRQSRPGTPVYIASPYSLPSPSSSSMHGYQQKHSSYRRSHQRTTSNGTGDMPRHQAASNMGQQQARAEHHSGVTEDDEEQDMDLEEGEVSEEGEILE